MEIFNINKEVLSFVFNRLRQQEGIKARGLISTIGDLSIFKILANVKYKQDHGLTISELERIVKEESGQNVRAYVWQKYDSVKNLIKSVPFEEFANKTIKEITKNIEFGKYKYNKIA